MDADKRRIWADIKRRQPGFAAGLTEIIKIMGKPAAIRIEIDGDVLLDTGINKARSVPKEAHWRKRQVVALAPPAPKPPGPKSSLPTLADLRNASPEDLARMKAQLRKKGRIRPLR